MGEHVRSGRGYRPLKDRPIGVAGCGRMGAPMLAALRRAGFDASGFDIRWGLGPGIGTDPAAFSDGLEILITVVRDAAETDALLFDDQALARCPSLSTIILCSTLPPGYITDLPARLPGDITIVDAPMSGAQAGAEEATLTFMLGGDDDTLSDLMPLFHAMGRDIHTMGGLGCGMTAKVLNNLLAASSTAMTRLVLDRAADAGMDERALLNLIHTASGQNWLASGFDRIEFSRDGYADDNSIGILVKDVEAALTLSPDADNTLPRAVQDVLRHLTPKG